ncbi:hypothetical protein [Methylobacterium gnaphalii]|uniref:Uncharacterized protein n=1 Tax=Methylobacterium gnaphalii TaxID=1010610 RepID=A0A512JIR3_9HYPH|nr:hypothetical protein [Methylobacterium gnaphalii]GEP09824.1 hypothetical protein MGN01_16690 [Methylobacterium gnaphalii]GJD67261.1 hypothetical protein MMMDOFMJ_0175 [Methylobacterium gnaphalii]GLS49854.1 hypothetical protein GCM10007885_27060 [Methylobacterium gnaphalii]
MLVLDASEFGIRAEAVGRTAKQVPFVAAFALTNAMKDARTAEQQTMRSVFDRPTNFTLNALKVTPATKTNVSAELGFKEGFGSVPAWKYLGPQVAGGIRRHKSFEMLLIRKGIMLSSEFAVPSKRCPVDGYGNVSRSVITRMLSALGAQADNAQNTKHYPKRSTRKRNLDYFVMRGHEKAPDGIYLKQAKWAVPMFLFVKSVSYQKRFPYYEQGRTVIREAYRRHFLAGWERFVVNDVRRKS